ncbi:N-terminal C2 in EEIG1 and EHBP1 proteins-domain-containing protein [Mycena epipterygia]|nr:N-terminal C2 in EEIG1 and EHBP1 proteins-domain-containing protein [Mycena epipterygia]
MTNHHPGDPPAPGPAPQPTGLRAQLHHLLPRHALFHVRITIHQLASVPLVHGEFGVRWKFKNTHKVKGKGKAKAAEAGPDGDDDSFGSADMSTEEPQTSGAPSSTASHSTSSANVLAPDDDSQASTSARGQTPWLPLRDHAVLWDQPLSAIVQMSIDRDTHRLLPHPFKLTVLQRVIARDPDAPNNPRFGMVELDLSEYADSVPATPVSKGVVTRRYLLHDSKTNATLRLSIRVDPVGTPPPFTAPPLPNGEILAGVATLLSTHADVYRTRPRALDLYAPVESNVKSDIQAFDVRALPRAYGPRPTESLIEALFNPAPVREERLVSPFTKLVTTDEESGSMASFPSTLLSSTSASSGLSVSAESGSLYNGGESMAPSSSGHSSLAPSRRPSAHGHSPRPSLSASVSVSLAPSASSSTHASASAENPSRHWWKRSRDRSRSRNRAGTPVAVA